MRGKGRGNLIAIDKQPPPPWPRAEEAREHCAWGASVCAWSSNDEGGEPDVVLAGAGDVATLETMAAAKWLRERAPGLRVRVVNVADLMSLFTPAAHPHGMAEERFVELFTRETDVLFAFHGYPGAVHQLLHGRPHAELVAACDAELARHRAYINEQFEDLPAIRNWWWAPSDEDGAAAPGQR